MELLSKNDAGVRSQDLVGIGVGNIILGKERKCLLLLCRSFHGVQQFDKCQNSHIAP